ncbi:hypothetical protein T439DRAFT_330128 [Meredithblackwellia eburnea MCA 4105]
MLRNSSILLDFLAPRLGQLSTVNSAAFSTSCVPSNNDPKATKAKPQAKSSQGSPPSTMGKSFYLPSTPSAPITTPATGASPSERTRHPKKPPSPPQSANSPRRKPLHKRPPLVGPSTSALKVNADGKPNHRDPVALLASIRSSASPSSKSSTAEAEVKAHNQAIHFIALARREDATLEEKRNALIKGWKVIRNSGEADRISLRDIGVLVRLGREVLWEGDQAKEWDWHAMKELLLWTFGVEYKNPTFITQWAWKELEAGREGAKKIEQIWLEIADGRWRDLRKGEKALNRRWQRQLGGPSLELEQEGLGKDTHGRERQFPTLFPLYVVAKCVLSTPTSLSPATSRIFKSQLAHLLSFNQSLSPTSYMLPHPHAEFFSKALHKALPSLSSADHALAWVRQTAHASMWYSAGSGAGEGLELVNIVKQKTRSAQRSMVFALWKLLVEGLEGEEQVGWIGTDGWAGSAKRRWVKGSKGLSEEIVELDPPAEGAGEGEVATDSTPTTPVVSPTAFNPQLTQALVAAFISSFLQNRNTADAGEIWTFLLARPHLQPGLVSWNGLVNGYALQPSIDSVESTFQEMSSSASPDLQPDVWTWLGRVSVHFRLKRPDEALALVDEMFRAKELSITLADETIRRLVYVQVLNGLFSCGRSAEAVAMVDEMEKSGLKPNMHVLNFILRHHVERRGSGPQAKPDFQGIATVLRKMADHGLEADVFTYSMVLAAITKAGHKDAVERLLKIMEASGVRASVHLYGSLIARLAAKGNRVDLQAAVKLLDEMESKGMKTNEIVYTSLIQGFLRGIQSTVAADSEFTITRDGEDFPTYFNVALALHKRMTEKGIRTNRVTFNLLIGSSISFNTPKSTAFGLDLFRRLMSEKKTDMEFPEEDAWSGRMDSWYTVIDAFAKNEDWSTARKLVGEMLAGGFEVKSSGMRRLIDRVNRGGWGEK